MTSPVRNEIESVDKYIASFMKNKEEEAAKTNAATKADATSTIYLQEDTDSETDFQSKMKETQKRKTAPCYRASPLANPSSDRSQQRAKRPVHFPHHRMPSLRTRSPSDDLLMRTPKKSKNDTTFPPIPNSSFSGSSSSGSFRIKEPLDIFKTLSSSPEPEIPDTEFELPEKFFRNPVMQPNGVSTSLKQIISQATKQKELSPQNLPLDTGIDKTLIKLLEPFFLEHFRVNNREADFTRQIAYYASVGVAALKLSNDRDEMFKDTKQLFESYILFHPESSTFLHPNIVPNYSRRGILPNPIFESCDRLQRTTFPNPFILPTRSPTVHLRAVPNSEPSHNVLYHS